MVRTGFSWLKKLPGMDCCEHSEELVTCLKFAKIFDQVSNNYLLEKNCTWYQGALCSAFGI
jgi:hypothetical protein